MSIENLLSDSYVEEDSCYFIIGGLNKKGLPIFNSEIKFFNDNILNKAEIESNLIVESIYDKGLLCLKKFKFAESSFGKKNSISISIRPDDLIGSFSNLLVQKDNLTA